MASTTQARAVGPTAALGPRGQGSEEGEAGWASPGSAASVEGEAYKGFGPQFQKSR